MTELQDQRRAAKQNAQDMALDGYAVLLRRADNPEPGDAVELADHMNTLGIDDAQNDRDVAAVAEYAQRLQSRLSDDDREAIKHRGAEELAAVHEKIQTLLVEMVQKLPPTLFYDAFHSLNRELIHAERGTPDANQQLVRAETFRQLQKDAQRAELAARNTLAADDQNNAELAALQRSNPEAFGRTAPAPKPTPASAGPHVVGQQIFIRSKMIDSQPTEVASR